MILPADAMRSRAFRQATAGGAGVALLFSLFLVVEMGLVWRQMHIARPIDHPRLMALRQDLGRDPGSDAIKLEIRTEERALRARYQRSDRQLRRGAWFLLGGLVVFVLCARLTLAVRPQVPMPAVRAPGYDPDRGHSSLGRMAVAVVTVGLVAAAVALPIVRAGGAEIERARGVWARFRGAGGLGISPHTDVPPAFDARPGQERNIRWKSVVPLPGLASPVVWNDRVFLSGALEDAREVYCFDALTGAVLWRRPVSAGPASSRVPENIYSETGYAAPTPVTDGKRVWALFANGDVVCLDVFGKQIWCVNLGLPENMYGLAASPILYRDQLVLQIDQEPGDEGDRSALISLRAATGDEVWRTPRDVASSWPTPIPIDTSSGPQILTCANPWVIAYDPSDGTEIWRADCLEGDGGPSPAFAGGLVFAVNIGSPLVAIRPDGKGEVTDTHVAWRWDDGLPDVCSLLAAGGLLWLQATDGLTTCLDARTGAKLWEQDHAVSFYSSPSMAGDRVYLIGRKGELFVLAAAREYRLLATGHLGEECDTSPAFAEGRIYVRGRRSLFCIEEPGS